MSAEAIQMIAIGTTTATVCACAILYAVRRWADMCDWALRHGQPVTFELRCTRHIRVRFSSAPATSATTAPPNTSCTRRGA
jgi:hypothetical protein